MEDDEDLTRLLAEAADPPVATPDSFREVLARHRRGRTRALTAALLAVALLGPAAGLAVGRATADNSTRVAAGSPDGSASDGSGDSVESRTDAATGSSSSGTFAPYPGAKPPPAPWRLFVRTTTDGVTIRAYLQENLPAAGETKCATDQGEVPCPTVPPECSAPTAHLQAGLSNDAAVDPGFVPVTTADPTGSPDVLHASYFGVMEGDPAAWVAVKADAAVARVRVRFADGATDEMVPVEGYAVLAHRTTAPPPLPPEGPAGSAEEWEAAMKATLPQGSAEALDANGGVLSSADLTSARSPFSTKCMMEMPPPPLGGGVPAEVTPAVPATAAPPSTVGS